MFYKFNCQKIDEISCAAGEGRYFKGNLRNTTNCTGLIYLLFVISIKFCIYYQIYQIKLSNL